MCLILSAMRSHEDIVFQREWVVFLFLFVRERFKRERIVAGVDSHPLTMELPLPCVPCSQEEGVGGLGPGERCTGSKAFISTECFHGHRRSLSGWGHEWGFLGSVFLGYFYWVSTTITGYWYRSSRFGLNCSLPSKLP